MNCVGDRRHMHVLVTSSNSQQESVTGPTGPTYLQASPVLHFAVPDGRVAASAVIGHAPELLAQCDQWESGRFKIKFS
jgi:hypothetical protein